MTPRARLAGLSLAALALCLAGCNDSAGGPRGQAIAQARAGQIQADPAQQVAVARGKIEVQGGLLEIAAPQDGTVEAVAVQEGAEVRRGQPLFALASEAARIDVAVAEADLKLARARQQAQAARLPAARQLAQRLAEAARAGAADPQRTDEAAQARRDIESAVAVAQAEVAVAREKLAQARYQAARQTVRAPQDATVVKVNLQPGSRVLAQGGRAALVLLPHRPLVVRAELNETFLAAVRPGMRATVATESDPPVGSKARTPLPSARVVRISPVYGASRLDDEAQLRTSVRVVDCYLEFDRTPDVRVGQDVRVSFHD